MVGLIPKGLSRAIRNNVMGISHEGASTITMQVAKNFFSQPGGKRDMITKIKEALLAIKIEKTISKDDILELYINQIYLGQRSYGFAAASQIYFGKQLERAQFSRVCAYWQACQKHRPVTTPMCMRNVRWCARMKCSETCCAMALLNRPSLMRP
jgi:membrane carboxypeptidase/penicillin-binding protein